jgi:hypothetical protein
MLDRQIVDAVAKGLFHIYEIDLVSEGIELLTGIPAGTSNETGIYPPGSVLGHAQKTLLAFHRACHAENFKAGRKLRY